MTDTILGGELLQGIQAATFRYTWRGVPLVKNPFDLALYPLLLWQVKPRTVIELGSHKGGSALWLADLIDAFHLEAHVHSVDLVAPRVVSHPRVTFHEQNVRSPLERGLLEASPHPWIVIDDSEHTSSACLSILRSYHESLSPGDYFVIEDGIVDALGDSDRFDGGPNRAVSKFLAEHPDAYRVDRSYCDFYGRNVTYNTDGYLLRL
ncbi:MAG TPA: CmcI family methyltransferase [Candidatus Krumholzibacteria bacterium]